MKLIWERCFKIDVFVVDVKAKAQMGVLFQYYDEFVFDRSTKYAPDSVLLNYSFLSSTHA